MRAVPIAAGRHHIVLTFTMLGLRKALAVSLVGLVALLILGRRDRAHVRPVGGDTPA